MCSSQFLPGKVRKMRFNCKPLWTIVGLFFLLLLYCEYLVYYFVLWQCHWPELASDHDHEAVLKAFFIADTHLLGSRQGHWFDKLRREWQMHRGFVSASQLLNPEVVFFLGDLFDEGKWSRNEEFKLTVERFHSLFPFENEKKLVVIGNHDVGFHYAVTPEKRKRFYKSFGLDRSGVRRVTLKNIHFVLIDSLAMHGDACNFCKPAMSKVSELAREIHCLNKKNKPENIQSECEFINYSEDFSRPILLQHFPLYRISDQNCHDEPDVLSNPKEKKRPFRPLWDCLSKESSDFLLEKFNPRLIISGHTHHGCRQLHQFHDHKIPEWSVASFSWRNRNNPVIVLATLTQDEFVLNKCYLPHESTVINVYIVGSIMILIYCILNSRRKWSRRF